MVFCKGKQVLLHHQEVALRWLGFYILHQQCIFPGVFIEIPLIHQQKQGRKQYQTRIGRSDKAIDVEHHDGAGDSEKEKCRV